MSSWSVFAFGIASPLVRISHHPNFNDKLTKHDLYSVFLHFQEF